MSSAYANKAKQSHLIYEQLKEFYKTENSETRFDIFVAIMQLKEITISRNFQKKSDRTSRSNPSKFLKNMKLLESKSTKESTN